MFELEIELSCYYSDDELKKNIDANLHRDIPRVVEGMFKDRIASICGSGPSMGATIGELAGDIWACNGAYNWLLEQGITAKYFFCWDAGKEVLPFISHPHPDTTFIISSTCDPEVFEALRCYNVIMWHANIGAPAVVHNTLAKYNRENNKREYHVGGGSACMTRAPYLLHTLGYKELHLHGIDSCLKDDGRSHIGAGEVGPGVREIMCLERTFKAPLWMAAQSQQFLPMVAHLEGTKIVVHGDGLIPHIAMMHNLHYNNNAAQAA